MRDEKKNTLEFCGEVMKRKSNFGSKVQLSDKDIRLERDWHKLEVYNHIWTYNLDYFFTNS